VRRLLGVSEESNVDEALAGWAGVENLEERMVPGKIDPIVLEQLRGQAGRRR
jgi:hypothetical protein